jgi:hypothetical protein
MRRDRSEFNAHRHLRESTMPVSNPHIRRCRRSPWPRRLRVALALSVLAYVVGIVVMAVR